MKNKLSVLLVIVGLLVIVTVFAFVDFGRRKTPLADPPTGAPAAATPAPVALQSLPNMGQQISPLALQGSRFETLNPDLADNPNWLAGQAVTSRGEPG